MSRYAIDTNLLVLLIVGSTKKSFIGKHRRLRQYGEEDYDLLVELLYDAKEPIITPQVLAEVSNLLVYGVSEPLKSQMMARLREFIFRSTEYWKDAKSISADAEFARLGIADCAWLSALSPGMTLLTDDLSLYLAAEKRGFNVRNFNHLREASRTV